MKKLISWIVVLAFVLTMVGPGPFTSTVQAQGLLNTGDYVYFGQYNGQPLLWRVITIDDDGDPLLFSEAIVTYKAFDGAENDAFSKFANRQTYGSNRWFDSNIREWLNSKSVFVTYSTTPPSAEAMLEGYNAYDQEPGFLYDFSSKDQEAIKPILHKELLSDADESFFDGGSAPHNFVNTSAKDGVDNYDSAYYEEVQDSVFLLSIKDLADYVQGRGWSYKKSGTAEALAKDESGLAKDSFGSYWLSTPASNKEEFVRYVYDGSYVYYTLAYDGSFGICPALYLDLDLVQLKTGAGTLASPYFVQGINEPIAISDANLEAAIRQTIDQPSGDILLSDVLNITKLDASGRRIESLDGLEKLANLEVIDISYNKIIDLSPLRNLKKIKRIYGQYNEIESLSTLFYDDVEVVSPVEEINITGNNLPATKDTTDKIKELEVKGIEVIYEEINEVNGGVEEIVSTSEGKTKEQLASEVDAVVKQAGFIELPAVNNTVTLTGELLYEPAESAMKVSKQAEKILIQKNLSLNRTIKSTVEVHPTGIDRTKPFTLMLDPTILDVNGADEIEVITEAISISFAPEKLQKDFQSTQLLQFIVQVT
ncbi:MAG: leucine-rich repeat domain-containing protein, partial [Vallitaleaceae bacterium]|nr:leucine-rich repeat domain-containing protein [Vallitaleaceae bacterium]